MNGDAIPIPDVHKYPKQANITGYTPSLSSSILLMSSLSHRAALANESERWPQSPNKPALLSGDKLLTMAEGLSVGTNNTSYLMMALDEIARLHPFVTGMFRS